MLLEGRQVYGTLSNSKHTMYQIPEAVKLTRAHVPGKN